MASDAQDTAELYKSAQTFMLFMGPVTKAMKAVFTTMYCHDKMDSEKGTLSLKECFENRRSKTPELVPEKIGGKKIENVGDIFGNQNGDERIYDDKDIINKEMDITFYFSAIFYFCKFEGCPSLIGEHDLKCKELKDQRNKFMHGISNSIDLDELRELCLDFLDGAEQELGGAHISKAKPEIRIQFQSVLEKEIDYEKHLQDREKYWKKLAAEFLRGSREEIDKTVLPVTSNPFTELLKKNGASAGSESLIEELFTPPLIYSKDKDEKVDFRDILISDYEDKPVCVVASGPSGSGKSTLCRFMVQQWLKKNDDRQPEIKHLDSIDLILHIELKFTREEKLCDFISKEYLKGQMRFINIEALVPLLRSLKILCILDGFDEKTTKSDDLICDIVSCLPKSQIIITSRPEFEEDCKKTLLRRKPVVWKIEGFSQIERKKFSVKVISMLNKNATGSTLCNDRFISYLESKASIFECQLKLPLTVALLMYVWLEDSTSCVMERVDTVTQLQDCIYKMLKKKLLENSPEYEQVLNDLHKLTFDQLLCSQHVLSKKTEVCIKNSCQVHSVEPKRVYEAFLKCETKGKASSYSFLSQSQIEFFGAIYASNRLNPELYTGTGLKDLISQKVRKYKGMFPYLAGLLAQNGTLCEHSKDLLELCIEAQICKNDYNFWLALLHETVTRDANSGELQPDDTLKKEIISHVAEKSFIFKPSAAVAGLKFLTFCPDIQIQDLDVELGDKDIDELEETLKKLHQQRLQLCGRQKTNLILKIKNEDFEHSFVRYFADWCNLLEFTGRVREDEVEHLLDSKTVNATFHDIEAFNSVAKNVSRMKNLEKLTISVNFPKNYRGTKEAIPITAERQNVTIDFSFLSLINNDIIGTVSFICSARPRNRKINRVRLHGNLSFDDGVQILQRLRGCVSNQVYVRSPQFLTEEQEKNMIQDAIGSQTESSFLLVWNDKELDSVPEE